MDEELLVRQVPQSLEAEQSVLGAILIDSRCLADVIGILQPEDFYLQQNREIFETIYAMFNFSQPIDPVTVIDKMKERGVYDEQNTLEYFKQLMDIMGQQGMNEQSQCWIKCGSWAYITIIPGTTFCS